MNVNKAVLGYENCRIPGLGVLQIRNPQSMDQCGPGPPAFKDNTDPDPIPDPAPVLNAELATSGSKSGVCCSEWRIYATKIRALVMVPDTLKGLNRLWLWSGFLTIFSSNMKIGYEEIPEVVKKFFKSYVILFVAPVLYAVSGYGLAFQIWIRISE